MTTPQKKIVLLLYMSRSGSTFLSKQLDVYNDVSVSIETEVLHVLLGAPDCVLNDVDSLLKYLREKDFRTENLILHKEYLVSMYEALDKRDRYAVAYAVLAAHFGEENTSSVWVVKCSMALPYLDDLARGYPELRFLHIIRDGRGVLNSKMHTKRVYRDGNMAEDVVTPARRWRLYLGTVSMLKERYPDRVYEVYYESLLRDAAKEFEGIRRFWGLPLEDAVPSLPSNGYYDRIPEKERSLHTNVNNEAQVDFINKWKRSLPARFVMVYEWLDGDILTEKGYELVYDRSRLRLSPKMWLAFATHYIKHFVVRFKRKVARMVNSTH